MQVALRKPSVQVALRRCAAQVVFCESCSVRVLCANCSVQVALRKCSAQVSLRKCSVQVALRRLLCANALRKLLFCASYSVQVALRKCARVYVCPSLRMLRCLWKPQTQRKRSMFSVFGRAQPSKSSRSPQLLQVDHATEARAGVLKSSTCPIPVQGVIFSEWVRPLHATVQSHLNLSCAP